MSAPAVPADTVWLAPGRSGEPPRFRPPSVGPRRAPGTVRRGREPHPWAAAIRRGAPAANPSRARAPSPPHWHAARERRDHVLRGGGRTQRTCPGNPSGPTARDLRPADPRTTGPGDPLNEGVPCNAIRADGWRHDAARGPRRAQTADPVPGARGRVRDPVADRALRRAGADHRAAPGDLVRDPGADRAGDPAHGRAALPDRSADHGGARLRP